MSNIIEYGSEVALNTFQGLKEAPKGIDQHDNYWQLIGAKGKVISEHQKSHPAYPDMGKRALVQFEENVRALGLTCHNETENSLWIFVSDLGFSK